jgi:hypothetical protein
MLLTLIISVVAASAADEPKRMLRSLESFQPKKNIELFSESSKMASEVLDKAVSKSWAVWTVRFE